MTSPEPTPQQLKAVERLGGGNIYCVNAMKLAWVKLNNGTTVVLNNYGDKVSK